MLCLAVVTVIGLVMGGSFVLLGSNLLGIYSSDPAVIQNGLKRMMVICAPYFICGWMDVLVGSLRGLGYAVLPMLVSLTGACGLRVVWLYTVFQWHPTLETLYLAYPVTWLVTAIAHLCCFLLVRRKFPKEDRRDAA